MDRRDALTEFAARLQGVRGRAKLDATAAAVFDAFAADGVDAVLLKGPALARMLYAAGETRGYSDVDVLVDPAHLGRARTALGRAGYVDVSDELGVVDVAGVVHDETWVGPDPDGHQMVDLHLRLPGAAAAPERVWAALAAGRTAIELAGREVPVLGEAGLALHLALHAAQHGAGHEKGIVDLRLGLERWPEEVWLKASALAAQIEAEAAFVTGLRLVGEGERLAELLGLQPDPRAEWAAAHRAARPRGASHLDAFADAAGPLARAGVVRRALLPRRAWIRTTYPWARGGAARLAAGYGVHVLRAPLWALRAWLHRRRGQRA
ncbi:MAG TPA: nucleotidyltransferase family protein [Solirubrobacteraceae bacterium]|nr:nucleotidyltransferase family protein [Solirubrobacteraceae bacterium]